MAGQFKRVAVIRKTYAEYAETKQGSQLIIGVIEVLGELERPHQRGVGFTGHTLREHEREPERGLQLHLVAGPATRGVKAGNGLLCPIVTFGQQRHPEPHGRRRRRKRDADGCVPSGRKSPSECCTKIVNFGRIGGAPVIRSGLVLDNCCKRVSIALRMASPDPFDLAAFGEFFERVGPRRLEQPKPRNGTADIRRNEDRTRRGQGKAAGKDRQAAQHDALGLREQLVAPVERRPQRLVPRQRSAEAAREQVKPIIEPGRNLWYPEHTTARCRQFDGERYAVEATANSRYDSRNATIR